MVRVRVRVSFGVIMFSDVTLVSVNFYGTAPDGNASHSYKKDCLPKNVTHKKHTKKIRTKATLFSETKIRTKCTLFSKKLVVG